MNDFKYRLEIFGANVSRTTHTTTRNNFEFRHSAFPAVSRNVVELRIWVEQIRFNTLRSLFEDSRATVDCLWRTGWAHLAQNHGWIFIVKPVEWLSYVIRQVMQIRVLMPELLPAASVQPDCFLLDRRALRCTGSLWMKEIWLVYIKNPKNLYGNNNDFFFSQIKV